MIKLLRNILLVVLLLMYIYEFNFTAFGLPTLLTSRRLAVLLSIIWAFIIKNNKGSGMYMNDSFIQIRKFTRINLLLLIYSFILIFAIGKGQGVHISDCIIRVLIFGVLPIYTFTRILKSIDELMKVLIYIGILQTIVIILGLANPVFGDVVYNTFVQEGAPDYRYGYAGGIACITAPGLIRYSTSLIACLFFIIKKQAYFYVILYAVLAFVGVMIARTGLLFAVLGLVFLIFVEIKTNHPKMIMALLVTACILIVFGAAIADYIGVFNLFDFHRLNDLFTEGAGNQFFDLYYSGEDTYIPPLSTDTLLGIGITSGQSANGIKINADGGFVRIYASLGLVLCLIFYISFYTSLLHICKRIKTPIYKYVMFFFMLLFVLAEYKEFTIYEQYMVCLFFTMSILIENKEYASL